MATITVYTLEEWDGGEDTYSTQDYQEAREEARKRQLRVIANEFEFSDSELVDDFTPEAARQAELETIRDSDGLSTAEAAELADLDASRH